MIEGSGSGSNPYQVLMDPEPGTYQIRNTWLYAGAGAQGFIFGFADCIQYFSPTNREGNTRMCLNLFIFSSLGMHYYPHHCYSAEIQTPKTHPSTSFCATPAVIL
jgi:hypothetical protein